MLFLVIPLSEASTSGVNIFSSFTMKKFSPEPSATFPSVSNINASSKPASRASLRATIELT